MANRNLRILSRDDQLVVAISLIVFFLIVGSYFWHRHLMSGGMIDFEDMPSRNALYLVDINSAPWQEFANLPGIGEKLAKEIVRYRSENGPFDCAEQLTEVSGIGQQKLLGVQSHITVADRERGRDEIAR